MLALRVTSRKRKRRVELVEDDEEVEEGEEVVGLCCSYRSSLVARRKTRTSPLASAVEDDKEVEHRSAVNPRSPFAASRIAPKTELTGLAYNSHLRTVVPPCSKRLGNQLLANRSAEELRTNQSHVTNGLHRLAEGTMLGPLVLPE